MLDLPHLGAGPPAYDPRGPGSPDSSAAGESDALAAAVAERSPGIVVADVRMPPTFTDEGLRIAVAPRHAHPGLPVMILSQNVCDQAPGVHERRGVGYLLKDRILEVGEFVDGVERVAVGGCVVDPEVVRRLVTRHHDPFTRLTPRERQ